MTRRLAAAIGVAALVVVAVLVVVVGTDGHGDRSPAAAANVDPNRSLTSNGGQFLASCPWTHSGPDDPIVHADHHGASHLHEFFGNASTDADSTYTSLRAAPSSCSDVGDRSAYWVPALYVDGERAAPTRADAYYRVPPGVQPSAVRPYPNGLEALAGDQHATTPQPLSIVAWSCGLSPDISSTPPQTCTSDRPVQLRLTFPSCWDGKRATSDDHLSHLAYPLPTGCPDAHPVPIPQLTLVVHYSVTGAFSEAHLASGPTTSAHGDFFNAWDPARLSAQTLGCLGRNVTCGITGGTFHTAPGVGDRDTYNIPTEIPS